MFRFSISDSDFSPFFTAPASILDMTDGEKGQTALHKAAWFQRRTICVMLVTAGASLTKTDFQGKTPRIQVKNVVDALADDGVQKNGIVDI